MIRDAIKSYKSDNRGSAIITGLVVSAVLMVLCLSLLLVAYSLFLSTSNATSDMPNKEMLYSAADVIDEEITSQTVDVTSYTVIDKNADADGQDNTTTTTVPSVLWDIIYQGISTKAWPYYKIGVDGHSDLDTCSKYYQMTSIGSVKIIVQLYWEPPKEWTGDYTQLNGTLLNVVYRLYNNDGELLVKVEKKYILEVSDVSTSSSSVTIPGINEFQNNTVSTPTNIFPNNSNILIEFICHTSWGSGCRCQIDITNNTGQDISDWHIEIFTNNTIDKIDSGVCNLLESKDGINKYWMSSNRTLNNGQKSECVIGFNANESCTKNPIVLKFNNIENVNYSNTSLSYTTWKWNRIS